MIDFNAKRYFLDEIPKRNLSEEEGMNGMFEKAIELSGRGYKQLFEVYRKLNYVQGYVNVSKYPKLRVRGRRSNLKKKELVNKIPDVNSYIKPVTGEELRMKYDYFFIFKKRLDSVGIDEFYRESDFIDYCGLRGQSGYRQALERRELDEYRGRAGGVTYYGNKEGIKKMKQEAVLT